MDLTVMMWGVVFGSVGVGYFMYGKKVANMVIRYTGLALMVFPYFIHNTVAVVLVGAGLIVLPKFVKL